MHRRFMLSMSVQWLARVITCCHYGDGVKQRQIQTCQGQCDLDPVVSLLAAFELMHRNGFAGLPAAVSSRTSPWIAM